MISRLHHGLRQRPAQSEHHRRVAAHGIERFRPLGCDRAQDCPGDLLRRDPQRRWACSARIAAPHRITDAAPARAHLRLYRADARSRWRKPRRRNYFRLNAQLANSGQTTQLLAADEYNAIAEEFIQQLRQLFPCASETALYDADVSMLASTQQVFANNLRLDSIAAGRIHTHDIAERYAAPVPFPEGGITRLATTRSPAP